MLKFRSMVVDAQKLGPEVTAGGDPRITRFGAILRKAKLDELPQLYNVLIGEMSFVGPRPEDPKYVAFYSTEQRRILSVRPGITSIASIEYRHEESALSGTDIELVYQTEIMPRKLALDLAYIERTNILTDIAIIFRTLAAVLR